MGGGDKGLLPLAGETLASHALRRLAQQVGDVVINANRHQQQYAALGHPVIADSITDFAGPLAGIHAGMMAAKKEWILSIPCDSPFFPLDLAKRLYTTVLREDAVVAVAVAGGRTQSVFLLAQRKLADDIAAFLARGDGKIEHWYRRLAYAEVAFADAAAFDNINTPEDLKKAEEKLRLSRR